MNNKNTVLVDSEKVTDKLNENKSDLTIGNNELQSSIGNTKISNMANEEEKGDDKKIAESTKGNFSVRTTTPINSGVNKTNANLKCSWPF